MVDSKALGHVDEVLEFLCKKKLIHIFWSAFSGDLQSLDINIDSLLPKRLLAR